jgi:hypothetical protein
MRPPKEWFMFYWTISVKKKRPSGSMSKGCARNLKKGSGDHAVGLAARIDEHQWSDSRSEPRSPNPEWVIAARLEFFP